MVAYLAATIAVGYLLDVFPDPREPGGSMHGFMVIVFLRRASRCGQHHHPHGRAGTTGRASTVGIPVWERLVAPLRIPISGG